jgi:hypothetical protein
MLFLCLFLGKNLSQGMKISKKVKTLNCNNLLFMGEISPKRNLNFENEKMKKNWGFQWPTFEKRNNRNHQIS